MGFDRLNRPILAAQYGSMKLWEMTKLTSVEQMATVHEKEQELLLRVLRRRCLEGRGGSNGAAAGQAEGGEVERQRRDEGDRDGGAGGGDADSSASYIVDTAVIVVDTAGLTLRHVSFSHPRTRVRVCMRVCFDVEI